MLMSVGPSECATSNGVEWPVPPQVTCVLCMDSCWLPRSVFQCLWGEMPILRSTIARVR